MTLIQSHIEKMRLKTQAKLIADPNGAGKVAGNVTGLQPSQAVENAAELEQKMSRVIRACCEMGGNYYTL